MVMSDEARRVKAWRFARAAGVPSPRVPSAPVGERMRRWHELEFSLEALASACGMSSTTVIGLMGSAHPSMKRHTAERIMAMYERDLFMGAAPHTMVPVYATRRRIRALYALGYSRSQLDEHLAGLVQVRVLVEKGRRVTRARNHRAVAEMFDAIHMHPGSCARARTYALKHEGYAPPLAWDDIDDPAGAPESISEPADDGGDGRVVSPCDPRELIDVVAIERAMAGERVVLTVAERHVAIVRMRHAGFSANSQIPDRLDVASRTVYRELHEHAQSCDAVPAPADSEQEWEVAS